MSSRVGLLLLVLKTVILGIVDSLSFHVTIPVLYESTGIFPLLLKIIGVNLFSFVGLVLIYSRGIISLNNFCFNFI